MLRLRVSKKLYFEIAPNEPRVCRGRGGARVWYTLCWAKFIYLLYLWLSEVWKFPSIR